MLLKKHDALAWVAGWLLVLVLLAKMMVKGWEPWLTYAYAASGTLLVVGFVIRWRHYDRLGPYRRK